jgi:HEAT repeat protein
LSDERDQAGAGQSLPKEIYKNALMFVINSHAATVNMRLYPVSSSMVTDTFEKAKEALDTIFEQSDGLEIATIENALLINDVRLDDVDQAKAPVKSFIAWMIERGLSNIEFRKGVTGEELKDFFSIIGEVEASDRAKLSEELAERGVSNVSINQRVYVAVTTNETGEIIGTVSSASAPLDALKDELLMRYLTGKVDIGDIADHDLVDILSDPGKVGGLLSAFLTEEGSEGGVLMKSQKAEDALGALAEMVEKIEDPTLRETMGDQITRVVAEMSPRQMTSVLTGEAPESLNITHIRENVIKMLSDNQLLDMIDALIGEYLEMKDEVGDLEMSWTKERLNDLNQLLMEVRGDRGTAISEVIDKKLDEAGIQEERDLHTGTRVLSAYDMLGGPLEEGDVTLVDGVDQTVPKQIRQLYAMEETDLAAGILLKLAGNFEQDSEAVRRFAAVIARDTLKGLDDEHGLLAAEVLGPTLAETMQREDDYESFRLMAESASIVAGLYMRAGRSDEAGSIIELLVQQSGEGADKGDELKRRASEAVSAIVGPEGAISTEALLLEDDEQKRLKTVHALASMGPEALAPLVDMVKDRGQLEFRDRALGALRAAGEPGIQAIVVELEKDNPWYIYRNILNVVAELKLVEALPQVTVMASSPDERIRREAVRSLARIGSPESMGTVMNAANDPSVAVRRTAVRVLGLFADASVASFLTDIINGQGVRGKEEDNAVVEAACLALGDLRDKSFVPQLAELLGKGGLFKKGRPDEIRAAACMALGTIGDPAAVPALEKAAKDPVAMVRGSADKSLRRMRGLLVSPEFAGDEEVVEAATAEVSAVPSQAAPEPAPLEQAPQGLEPLPPPEPELATPVWEPELPPGEAPAPPPAPEQAFEPEAVPALEEHEMSVVEPEAPQPQPHEPEREAPPYEQAPAAPAQSAYDEATDTWRGEEAFIAPEDTLPPQAGPSTIEYVIKEQGQTVPAAPDVQPPGYSPPEPAPPEGTFTGASTLEEMILESGDVQEQVGYQPGQPVEFPADQPAAVEAGPSTMEEIAFEGAAAQQPDDLAGQVEFPPEGPPAPEMGPSTLEEIAGGTPSDPVLPAGEPGMQEPATGEQAMPGHTLPSQSQVPPELVKMWPEGGSLNGHDHPVPPPPEVESPQAGRAEQQVEGLPDDDFAPGRLDQPSTMERMLGQEDTPGPEWPPRQG